MSEPDWRRRFEALCDAARQHALTLDYLNPGALRMPRGPYVGRAYTASDTLEVRDGKRVYEVAIDRCVCVEGEWGWQQVELFAELERPVESTTDKVLKTQT